MKTIKGWKNIESMDETDLFNFLYFIRIRIFFLYIQVCEDQCIAFQLMQIAEHTVYHLSTSHFWWVAKLYQYFL